MSDWSSDVGASDHIFRAQSHRTRHLGFGNLDFLAAESGKPDVGYYIIFNVGGGCSGHNGLLSLKPELKAAQTMAARTAACCINPGLQKQIKNKGIFICCRTTDPTSEAYSHPQGQPGGAPHTPTP